MSNFRKHEEAYVQWKKTKRLHDEDDDIWNVALIANVAMNVVSFLDPSNELLVI